MKQTHVRSNPVKLASTAFSVALSLALSQPMDALSGVIPPNQVIFTKTYAEWDAVYWKWALNIPLDGKHPFTDATGANATRNQSGPVFFLAGSFNGQVTRQISVPEGLFLYVPVVNVECSTAEDPPFYGATDEDLLTAASNFVETDLLCEVDGASVPNLSSFHFNSPVFDVAFPPNNIFGVVSGPARSASAGVSVMLEPLSPGVHTIRFGGGYAGYNNTTRVTYRVTVYERPVLSIRRIPDGGLLEISWTSSVPFRLQGASEAEADAAWTDLAIISETIVSGRHVALTSALADTQFIRLYRAN